MTLLVLVALFYVYAIYAQTQLYQLNRLLPEEVRAESLTSEEAATGGSSTPMEIPEEALAANWNPFPQGPPAGSGDANQKPPKLPPANRIVIPRIELDSSVIEVSTKVERGELVWQTASNAVGHHQGTADPGEVGNVVLSGHIRSLREGMVFNRLPELAPGDTIYLYSELGKFRYKVVETRVVLPTAIWVMDPTPDLTLTLITCVPDWVYSHRLIVTAKPY